MRREVSREEKSEERRLKPEMSGGLETLLRRLFPTPLVPTPSAKPVPSDLVQLLQRLLVGARVLKPTPPIKTGISDVETLLQNLLPGIPVSALQTQPGPIRWDWTMVVCFSCGKAGHGATQCPALNEAFPFMLPGWKAEKVGARVRYDLSPSGSVASPGGKRRQIREGGQPPGSVIELDPRTLVVVKRSPTDPIRCGCMQCRSMRPRDKWIGPSPPSLTV